MACKCKVWPSVFECDQILTRECWSTLLIRTAGRQIIMTMREVLRNQQLIGSTMGSHNDLVDATAFLAEHRIIPVVAHVIDGLKNAEEGFKLMKRYGGFGKVVIKIVDDGKKGESRL